MFNPCTMSFHSKIPNMTVTANDISCMECAQGWETKIGLHLLHIPVKSGKMPLRWLTTILNSGLIECCIIPPSVSVIKENTSMEKHCPKRFIFSFRKELFFLSGNSGSLDLSCLSVMQGLHKQMWAFITIFIMGGTDRMSFRSPDHQNLCPDKHSFF